MLAFKTLSRCLATGSTENIRQFLKKSEDGFDRVLQKMNILNCENGRCLAEMKIQKEHTNPWESMHGGLSATIMGIATSFALSTARNATIVPSVAVDMHISFLKSVAIGEEIVIDAKVLRAGKSIAYTSCEIRNKATGIIVARGTYTKFMLHPKE